jgi:hypothetical protein
MFFNTAKAAVTSQNILLAGDFTPQERLQQAKNVLLAGDFPPQEQLQ